MVSNDNSTNKPEFGRSRSRVRASSTTGLHAENLQPAANTASAVSDTASSAPPPIQQEYTTDKIYTTTLIEEAISIRERDNNSGDTSDAANNNASARTERLYNIPTNIKDTEIKRLELIHKMNEANIQDYIVIEDRIRQDYFMFRDVVREENTLVMARQGTFRTFTGFLWAAIGLALSRLDENKTKSIVLLVFLLMVTMVGIAVSILFWININHAYDAIETAGQDWQKARQVYIDTLEKKVKKGKFEYLGPQLMGGEIKKGGPDPRHEYGGPDRRDQYAPILFGSIWCVVMVCAAILIHLVRKDKIEFG